MSEEIKVGVPENSLKRTVYFEPKRPANFYRPVFIFDPLNIIDYNQSFQILPSTFSSCDGSVKTRWTVHFDQRNELSFLTFSIDKCLYLGFKHQVKMVLRLLHL